MQGCATDSDGRDLMRHSNSTCCLAKMKSGATGLLPRPEMKVGLEDEFASEFEGPRIICAGDSTKAAFGGAIIVEARELLADVVELRVVEGVEGLHTKLEVRSLGHSKGLVD